LAGLFAMQKFIQTYIIFKERVILRIVKLFFHNNLTDSIEQINYVHWIKIYLFFNIYKVNYILNKNILKYKCLSNKLFLYKKTISKFI
ncbi:hypothetical protein C0L85_11350, partial [Clostridium perfringens]